MQCWTSLLSIPLLQSEAVMTSTNNSTRINSIIDMAKASGKCPPFLESVWRAIGEKDPQVLEKLYSETPSNPAFAQDVCYSAERAVDSLLHPILNDLMNARATIDAFSEAAICTAASTKLYWPSLMESLKKVTPRDDDLDNAITQIYGVVEKAVAHALQGAAATKVASNLSAVAPADRKPDATRKRGSLTAKALKNPGVKA
jgi:hypothetical protein